MENASSETWRSGEQSGIALTNRWLNSKEKVVHPLDGWVRLAGDLSPGSRVELELLARAPRKPGRWFLELDLVDEGITRFGDQGSARTRLDVHVRRGRRIDTAVKTLFHRNPGTGWRRRAPLVSSDRGDLET